MTRQLILDLSPSAPPSFDNYVVGDNAAAVDAVQQARPGQALYLWGAPGVGRSHLLQAATQDRQGLYCSAATAEGTALLRTWADTDPPVAPLLAIDDVSASSDAAQSALFTLYNRWREAGRGPDAFILLMAGDQAPMASQLREDLRTRLGWDLVFRLELLSDARRAEALHLKAAQLGLHLPAELTQWILTHHSRDMRQLAALIDALDRYSLERHRPLTLPLLKELLAHGDTATATDLT